MMVDLKPCPFCGCAPVVDGDKIVCPEQHCWGPIVEHYDSIDDAAEAWNRRALSPAGTASEIEPVGYVTSEALKTAKPGWHYHMVAADQSDEKATIPLFAHPPASVQEGWVMVPREPTEAMLDAHYDAHATSDTVFADARDVWAAMIAAAPAPPNVGE